MKNRRTKKIMGAALALVLAVVMLFVFLAPSSAAALDGIKETLDGNGDSKINYLAVGSAANGEGVAKEDSYAELVKAELEATGKQVELTTLGFAEMRVEEFRYLLDDSYAGDDYTEDKLSGDVDALRAEYIAAVKNAEFITIDLGAANFLTYVFEYVLEEKHTASLDGFDDGIQKTAGELKARFEDVLKGYDKEGDPATADLFQRIIDSMCYALVGYAVNFDEVIANIYKHNPDVVITVKNVSNPINGVGLTMPGLDVALPLDIVYGVVVDIANLYVATLSEYAGSFNFAYLANEGKAETFEADLLAGNVSKDMAAYLAESYGSSLSEAGKGALVSVIKAGLEYADCDVVAAAGCGVDVIAKVKAIVAAADIAGFSLEANADYLAIKNDKGAMAKLAFAVRYGFGGLPMLPSANGHKEIADAVVLATVESKKGEEVIENDMNSVYSMFLPYFTRETLTDLEYTFSPYYVRDTQKSYYVGFGDGSALGSNSYVGALAKKLGYHNGNSPATNTNPNNSKYSYVSMASQESTPESLLKQLLNTDSREYKAALKSDLITLSFNNASTTSYALQQVISAFSGTPQVNDWASIFAIMGSEGEKMAADLVAALDEVKAELAISLGDETIANVMFAAVESYAYAYLSRLVNYPLVVDKLHEITKGKALVVIVGAYNEMADFTVKLEGEEICLGDYVQYIVDVANLETLVYSMFSENTAYITCPEVDIKANNLTIDLSNFEDASNIMSLVPTLTSFTNIANYNITDASHTKIANEIYGTLNIVAPHGCDYDNDCDNRCNICMKKRVVADHVFDAVCDEECNVCRARNKHAALHTYDAACDSVCNVCSKVRESSDHLYSGACDATCDYCGLTREAAEHSFGEWVNGENEKTRTCTVCGFVEKAEPSAGGNGLVIVIVAAAVAVLGGGAAAVYFLVIKKKPSVNTAEAPAEETESSEEE